MSKEPWRKELSELAKEVDKRLKVLETGDTSSSPTEENHMPELYKCKGKDCGYATDDIHDFITHVVRENVPKAPPEAQPEPEPKTHRTAKDYLDCPECFPKFEKEFLARGYTKPEEKKNEKGLF